MYAIVQDATVLDLYRKVEGMLPNNSDLRLSITSKELRKDQHGQDLLNKYAEHCSQVVVLLRQRGGNEDHEVQILHSKGQYRHDRHYGY